ncbi:MAG: NUDIX hydrolase [Bacillota bacterium]|nr:NUDIX hydrolase [Bacillota bacterium]
MIYREKTLESHRIYEGAILNLRRDRVLVKGDRESWREVVEHNGGVTLAAVTEEGKIVLVRQFRYAAGKAVLEAPAGKIEKGEDPLPAALRELKEETGYTAANIKRLCSFYSSIGYSTEIIHLYLATGLTPGTTDFDDNEAIDVVELALPEARAMVLRGEIEDAKTIAAILMAASAEETEKLL